jgi:hypothetical protein
MASDAIIESRQPIKEASTNTTTGSKVKVEAEHPPRLYFRPETGFRLCQVIPSNTPCSVTVMVTTHCFPRPVIMRFTVNGRGKGD